MEVGKSDSKPCSDIIEAALKLVREEYPCAQQAFLECEVFEQLKSRQIIKRFASIFEVISGAVSKDCAEDLQQARQKLRDVTLRIYIWLCSERLREIDKLEQRTKFFWRVLFLHNPFDEEPIRGLYRLAFDHYAEGIDRSQSYKNRVSALQQCFSTVENALAEIQTHRIYDHIFSIVQYACFTLLGCILGALLFL